MRTKVVSIAAEIIKIEKPKDPENFLDNIHKFMTVKDLNQFRLELYHKINNEKWLRPTYFKLGRHVLDSLVGNELAMQNRINLSIQMPSDRSSLLDIHADVFGGETPYQVVQWLPLVDVYKTKSMFVLPKIKSDQIVSRLVDFSSGGMRELFEEVKKDIVWLDIPYGKVLIFTPNILHGNVLNDELSTRWSLNCRFTSLLTPYGSAEKSLGSFYLPITPRPVTKIGVEYKQPNGFSE